MSCAPIKNGNVILVEPNCINVNNNIVNGIPQYQDMYIFAELTAKSKGRTVIINGNTSSTTSKSINFIGNNQNSDDPNYLNFTTNYYDGSTSGTHYEGFGINNIKIVVNSSFIPQVDIQFIDVRGLAFFNQVDSPYRILFDFPPPIFTLTVKGYYGKPVTYQLHLVKYTSEFSSANGNFVIDAQFVAVTFAPLTDILFRYVVNAPLINNEESMNPEPGVRPTNTFELIKKLENLYAAVSDKLETDAENIHYESILNDIEKIDFINEILAAYKDSEVLAPAGKPYLVTRLPEKKDNYVETPKTNSVSDDALGIIENLEQFNAIIKSEESSGTQSVITKRLYLVFVAATNVKVSNNSVEPQQGTLSPTGFEFISGNDSNFELPLTEFKNQLLAEAKEITSVNLTDTDISAPKAFLNAYNAQTGVIAKNPASTVTLEGYTKYYGIDVSGLYYKIYKKKAELEKEKNELSLDIARKINAMVAERLGMIPSIYNVFEIILNDVDTFFNKVKSTSKRAYESHNIPSNKQIILGDNSYSETKNKTAPIYSFPLVINQLPNREERVAPIALSKKVGFPELDLVSDFMDTFMLQNRYNKLINARNDQNDDGENKWIPISPIDSTLGGAVPASPYINLSDDVRTEMLRIMMERFYIFTQGTVGDTIYIPTVGKRRKDKANLFLTEAYVKLYGVAEAINLATALSSETVRKNLKVMSNEYTNTNLTKFYQDIKDLTFTYDDGSGTEKIEKIYSFPQNDPKYFSVSPTSEGRVYLDKTNDGFNGLFMVEGYVEVQSTENDSSNPIDGFVAEIQEKRLLRKKKAEAFFDYTTDNLMYIRDKNEHVDPSYDGILMFTRYVTTSTYFRPDDPEILGNDEFRNPSYPGTGDNDVARQQVALAEGNNSFTYISDSEQNFMNRGQNIWNHWSNILGVYDDSIIGTITGSTSQNLSSMLILSNFGYSASPFNVYANALNSIVFNTPAIVEVPRYYAPYLGMLLHAIEYEWVDEIENFFFTGAGADLPNRGFYIFADLHDVENYLCENDKRILLSEYTKYMNKYYPTVVGGIEGAYKNVVLNKDVDVYKTGAYSYLTDRKKNLYKYFFDPTMKKNTDITSASEGQFFASVMKNLMYRTNMLVYSDLTFKMSGTTDVGYTSLEQLNTNGNGLLTGSQIKTINDNYFLSFFQRLNTLVDEVEIKLKEEEEELKKVKGDVDVINQLYYSFKNINDKWLTGTNTDFYPFNQESKRLIDSFAFVDRGMNPIGETILNCEILGELLNDTNISLFSVLTQLLSLNGFEFFPLQNFLNFETENSWEDTFKIHTGGYDDAQNPFFVCMYIGGSSSYPSVAGNGFQNDGIIDITEPGVAGFTGDDSGSQYEENQNQEQNQNFPWREVRAFRVRFGEQNQSMFKDIKIDSKEYPETNESIQILSRLAGDDNPSAPVPKGQNLYNLYENRSYKATVNGFGNMMIQPTQYFQLENIPMFNGAYIILSVEHNITANKMETSFSGTKLLKYPMPRVLTPVAFTSYDGLSGADAVRVALSAANLAKGMTPERVGNSKAEGGLEGELGIDVSHWNGNINWKETKKDNVTFAFIKLTDGKTGDAADFDDYDLDGQISSAISNGINVSYYHFARFGRTASPTQDGIDDANNFLTALGRAPQKPKLPVVLDLEEDCFKGNTYSWGSISKPSAAINEYTKSFIDTMEASGYDVMIYCRNDLIQKWNLNNWSKYPYWVARYYDLDGKYNPERDEPSAPTAWKNGWQAWQFTPAGSVAGVHGNVDLNVMKKSFIQKYT